MIIIGILVAVYIAATPYITVYQIKSAAEQHDGEKLSEYIEFPSVRQSLKTQLNAIIAEKTEEKKSSRAFAMLGAALAGSVVDKVIEAYVTPSSIIKIMSGEKISIKKEEDSPDTSKSTKEMLEKSSLSYESFNTFVVKIHNKNSGKEDAKFVLQRRGIGWKITEIIIPVERLSMK